MVLKRRPRPGHAGCFCQASTVVLTALAWPLLPAAELKHEQAEYLHNDHFQSYYLIQICSNKVDSLRLPYPEFLWVSQLAVVPLGQLVTTYCSPLTEYS